MRSEGALESADGRDHVSRVLGLGRRPPAKAARPLWAQGLSVSKVLLVDNETTRVTDIRQALERGGFETVSAADGNEALKTFLNEVPDLVMVGPLAADPDENFCQRMRETRPGTTIPILLYCESLSGDALKAALERSGCNVYVEMPASDERLVEVCRHALLESVEPGPAEAPEAVATAEASAFASPAAALAQLETSGSDIDAHLDVLFETGEAPDSSDELPVSLETDISELPLGPVISQPDSVPEATMAAETESPIDSEAPPAEQDLESGRDPVGFQPDAVSFEDAGEVDPGIQPEIASEAASLIQSPCGSPAPAIDEPAGFTSTDTDIDTSSAGSLDLDVDEFPDTEGASPVPLPGLPGVVGDSPGASPVADSPGSSYSEMRGAPYAAASTSRGWLWGILALAAVIGSIGLFFVLRPAPSDDSGAGNLASMRPATPAPRVPAAIEPATEPAIDAGNAAVDPLVEEATDDAAEMIDDSAAEASASVNAAHEKAVDVADAGAAVAIGSQETAEATITEDATDTGPETTTADSRPAPVEVPVAPKPAPVENMVFQPSTEIVDAATAGEGFQAPRSINRVEPTYNPQDLPDGGETVTLRVLVNDWGKAVRVEIEQGRASSPLVNAAIDAVLNTRYQAAELRGRQVRAWTTETFEFE